MSDHTNNEWEFGEGVDAGYGVEDNLDQSTEGDNDDHGKVEFEPEYQRMTRKEVMSVGNSDDDVDDE